MSNSYHLAHALTIYQQCGPISYMLHAITMQNLKKYFVYLSQFETGGTIILLVRPAYSYNIVLIALIVFHSFTCS